MRRNFRGKLWKWITRNFCLEGVVTFTSEATPFPDVDTNPLIFFIKKAQSKTDVFWVKCKKSWTKDLKNFVASNFKQKTDSLEIHQRNIEEGIKTGLSRLPENKPDGIELSQFARVMRGIATGANEFFFSPERRRKKKIFPLNFYKLLSAEQETLIRKKSHLKTLTRSTKKEDRHFFFRLTEET